MRPITFWYCLTILFVAVCLDGSRGSFAGPKPKEWEPEINPANFISSVTNPYFPLPLGRVLRYRAETKDGLETLHSEVTTQTKTIMGVTTVEVVETHALDGDVIEISRNWFAQDIEGTVWYFGELSINYEFGVPVDSAGSWEAGVDDALPGIIMPANPEPGDSYFQEFAVDIAQDQASVMNVEKTVSVPHSVYSDVLKTKEWTTLEPNSVEHKYYAPGIGLILEENGPERLELIGVD